MGIGFIATTNIGLEEESVKELKNFEYTARIIGRGRIKFYGKKKAIYEVNYLSRTINRLYLLLDEAKIKSLQDIYSRIKKIDFSSFVDKTQSFAVRVSKNSEFRTYDIAERAGQAVIDSFRESTGIRLKVDLENPDIIIRVDVHKNKMLVCLDTTGDEALYKRRYRVYQHPAPLKPTICAALIQLAGTEEILDPMCGSGTILIEAASKARNLPSQRLRESFQFQKLKFFDGSEWKRVRKKAERNINWKKYDILGLEKFRKHVEGAKLNAKKAGVADTITFKQYDATKLHTLDFSQKIIVTNPPYGLRIGSMKKIKELYSGFAESVRKTGIEKLVILTARYDLMSECLKKQGFALTKVMDTMYGNLPARVMIAKK
jgi:tRNA (guanine6-N2)-methyltransferase